MLANQCKEQSANEIVQPSALFANRKLYPQNNRRSKKNYRNTVAINCFLWFANISQNSYLLHVYQRFHSNIFVTLDISSRMFFDPRSYIRLEWLDVRNFIHLLYFPHMRTNVQLSTHARLSAHAQTGHTLEYGRNFESMFLVKCTTRLLKKTWYKCD